ncbi:MAG: glycosyltransferase family 39 protein [Blastocatellia bacterium]
MNDVAKETIATSEEGVEHANRDGKRSSDSATVAMRRDRAYDRLAFWLVLVVLGIAFVLHLGMVAPGRFGGYYDDTIYVTAAKSLATGQGYKMISLPQPVAQTLVPPFYPFVLSLVWRLDPRFPQNLRWMMLVSVIAMMGFLLLIWRYLVMNGYASRWQALAVIALAAINWRQMSLATSIISEVVFALLSVATLLIAERYEKEQSGWRTGAGLGLMAGLAFLTRTSGLVLLAAVVVYYLYRRRWTKVLVPVAVASLFIIGWFGWGYLNRNTIGGEHAAYYAGYVHGITETVGKLQAVNHVSRLMVHLKIIETNALGLILVWGPLQTLGLRASLSMSLLIPVIISSLALIVAGFARELRKGPRLLEIYLVFYIALHLVVPGHSYERYVMPIVPFLLFFLIRELSALLLMLRTALTSSGQVFAKAAAATIGLVVAVGAAIALYSNSTGIYHALASPRPAAGSEADAEAIDWIVANTDPSSVLVGFGDLKYYLYTGRKAVRSIPVTMLDINVYQATEPDSNELLTVFRNITHENRGAYMVLNEADFRDQAPAYGKSIEAYVKQHPEEFVPMFESKEGRTAIYRIDY